MEISLAPEIRAGIGRIGFRQAREAFRDTVGGILADPFGPTSIDEFKDTDAGRTARLVHRVVHPMLADIVPGKKLALK